MTPTRLYETPIRPAQAPPPKAEMDIVRFSQKGLDQIIQSVLQA